MEHEANMRQQVLAVALDRSLHPPRDKRGSIFGQPDELIRQLERVQRDRGYVATFTKQEGRRPVITRTKRVQYGLCATEFIEIGVDHHGADQRIGSKRRRTIVRRAREDHVESTPPQLLDERNPGALKCRSGSNIPVHDQNARWRRGGSISHRLPSSAPESRYEPCLRLPGRRMLHQAGSQSNRCARLSVAAAVDPKCRWSVDFHPRRRQIVRG
jgi:hypothetical protein